MICLVIVFIRIDFGCQDCIVNLYVHNDKITESDLCLQRYIMEHCLKCRDLRLTLPESYYHIIPNFITESKQCKINLLKHIGTLLN